MSNIPSTDIIFDVAGPDGSIKCELIPLKQRDAGRVFHTCVSQLLGAVTGILGETDQQKQIASIAAALGKIDFDLVWDVASALCKDAVIGGKEVRSLDDVPEISDAPWILYLIIFHGVKGNWPRVFSGLGAKLDGFGSQIMDKMGMATPD
jgi:hypothetical protein